ncbi:hypothetical protein RBG61_06855 [Paludicola sp. MB14-C6]|uniref:PHP domain-containing protein n=1 Tax=Paludihabitans sp. MB14-C6 TaxID=3070656 RepID=UPI0027DD3247|nr:PHP domain-containing protein [Paludicola sp. MB14-C6]WMJ24381.1 hypothetical protein RBG61_06855 [Paludicola sp. MB14-C6]
MAKSYLLPKASKQFKSNLHAHTIHSDGALTPQQMKALYQEHGYHIIAYTDHNVLNYFKELDEENFLALCGYEVDAYTQNSYGGFEKTCHLNLIARNPQTAKFIEKPAIYSVDSINDTIEKLYQANYIIHYNHPGWSAEEPADYLNLNHISAMEIYNHGCEVETNDGDARNHYDIILKHGLHWNCISTDDNHNHNTLPNNTLRTETDSCGGYTMICAPTLTYDSVIQALDDGNYYCCMGEGAPEIYHYYIEDSKLVIDCSPVKGVFVKSNSIGARFHRTSTTDSITHAEFDLTTLRGDEPYLRIELADSKRRMTFTNPYYL